MKNPVGCGRAQWQEPLLLILRKRGQGVEVPGNWVSPELLHQNESLAKHLLPLNPFLLPARGRGTQNPLLLVLRRRGVEVPGIWKSPELLRQN
jgi:hypothetical protein